MFELTYNCNFKCKHCYVPQSFVAKYARLELDTKKVLNILRQLKEAGCFYLGFTGGEPLMRRDFMKIIEAAKRLGFLLIVYTNGSLVNRKIAARFRDMGINKVDITIPGMSVRAFERVTGVSGSHKRVFNAIELLHKNGVPLGFKSCLLKDNETEIRDIERFAHSLKAQFRLDTGLVPRLDGSKKPFLYRVDKYAPIAKLKAPAYLFCGSGKKQAAITPAGELKACVMMDKPKYSTIDSSFACAWQRLKGYFEGTNKPRRLSCPEFIHEA